MPKILLLNKPFGVLPQFTDPAGRATLASCIRLPGVHPAGRLDRDSEGLLLLTNYGPWQHYISHPRHGLEKTYWVQVEGSIDAAALQQLCRGITLRDGQARALRTRRLDEPVLWPRHPPIRQRAAIPVSWLELIINEGRNRQVRRMTAAVGYPTLRLVRMAIGPWSLGDLQPGQSRLLDAADLALLPGLPQPRRTRPPTRRNRRGLRTTNAATPPSWRSGS